MGSINLFVLLLLATTISAFCPPDGAATTETIVTTPANGRHTALLRTTTQFPDSAWPDAFGQWTAPNGTHLTGRLHRLGNDCFAHTLSVRAATESDLGLYSFRRLRNSSGSERRVWLRLGPSADKCPRNIAAEPIAWTRANGRDGKAFVEFRLEFDGDPDNLHVRWTAPNARRLLSAGDEGAVGAGRRYESAENRYHQVLYVSNATVADLGVYGFTIRVNGQLCALNGSVELRRIEPDEGDDGCPHGTSISLRAIADNPKRWVPIVRFRFAGDLGTMVMVIRRTRPLGKALKIFATDLRNVMQTAEEDVFEVMLRSLRSSRIDLSRFSVHYWVDRRPCPNVSMTVAYSKRIKQ